MFLLDDDLIYSASDLTAATSCEFALLRTLDERLGLVPPRERIDDPMMTRTATLGDAHEASVLAAYVSRYGDRVIQLDRARHGRAALEAARDATLRALQNGAAVVAQGAFFDGRFNGYADFLVRTEEEVEPTYRVLDSKLARTEKVSALLQIAAYADQLVKSGIPVAPEAGLILGDGTQTSHRLSDIVPVYLERRHRLQQILDSHRSDKGSLQWGDPRFLACGRCDVCDEEVQRTRDLLMVAGMRASQRKHLRSSHITTIDELAAHVGDVEGMTRRSLDDVRAQAALQTGFAVPDGNTGGVPWELHSPAHLATLPPPSDGDLFFDFEGDPLWVDELGKGWGLEYLFGVMEPEGTAGNFVSFWAHDRGEEKQALIDFLAYVTERRERFPDMHIYHYAAYEKSALLRLAGRHSVGEDAVDDLLREGVLVDLYATVRHCLRISGRSYSIKALEPLYMGDDLRRGGVKDAAASIVAYQDYCDLVRSGESVDAEQLSREIGVYNEYDCLSTWRLRDWLLARGAERNVYPANREPDVSGDDFTAVREDAAAIEDELSDQLISLIEDVQPSKRNRDQQAIAMLAAALGYHQRERKPFWWAHFDRLIAPVDELLGKQDAWLVDDAVVLEPWSRTGKQRNERRTLQLSLRSDVGNNLEVGAKVCCLYEDIPSGMNLTPGAIRAARESGEITGRSVDEAGHDLVTVSEIAPRDIPTWSQMPMALAPTSPPRTTNIEAALHALGEEVLDSWPDLPDQPALDLLRRVPPRCASATHLPAVGDGESPYVEAITHAVRDLDDSYLAVQGPPGTGKTYVGSHVVANLVQAGWRVGVVAQSHAVVENFLCAVVLAGVPPEQVGKVRAGSSGPNWTWTELKPNGHASFIEDRAERGCVVGGTAWDFTNTRRIDPGSLDLVVVDEAGQFSVADTIAVSTAARRLLLLGDPQQLPQVSQGTHPEPVDGSALGWLAAGHDTLPTELGYFLERTWRMHPRLCEPVSILSYEGKLHSQEPQTTDRSLTGVEPGVQVKELDHRGRSTWSEEEATEVVRQVQRFAGIPWRDGISEGPLGLDDILVVAPYNAQVSLIRRRLMTAGLAGVRVGTVDKFQGQEAPVVIVSMTASAIEDVPRGMSFLLSRNRINVAVSRGQWLAVIVRSLALTDFLPSSPAGLAELGAFIGLCSPHSAIADLS